MTLTKKPNQLGMLSLHAIVPLLLVVLAVGGIGAYVLQKSKAASPCETTASQQQAGCATSKATAITPPSDTTVCGKLVRSGNVYYSALGTNSAFTNARNSDSIKNLAYALCVKGYLAPETATQINADGNYTSALKTSFSKWQVSLGAKSKDATGIPTSESLRQLDLNPIGF